MLNGSDLSRRWRGLRLVLRHDRQAARRCGHGDRCLPWQTVRLAGVMCGRGISTAGRCCRRFEACTATSARLVRPCQYRRREQPQQAMRLWFVPFAVGIAVPGGLLKCTRCKRPFTPCRRRLRLRGRRCPGLAQDVAWRGPHGPDDPLLATARHRANRAYWKRQKRPCARCGGAIDYTGKTFIVINGKRRLNPLALVVGHIVGRYEAKRMGWNEAQINALSNTQPECARCSVKSGARLGRRLQGVKTRRQLAATGASRW